MLQFLNRLGAGCAAVGLAGGMVAALWLTGCRPAPEGSRGVQLLLSSARLESTTTFELRFDSPVVAMEAVGLPAGESPLVFLPPVKGEFVWQSRRSGTFTPEEPLRLAAEYRVTLRRGLRDAAGRPVTAGLQERLTTPPFAGTVQRSLWRWRDRWEENEALPTVYVIFNAAVRIEALEPLTAFVSSDGRRVPAQVEPFPDILPVRHPVPGVTTDGADWVTAFYRARDREAPGPSSSAGNRFAVTPRDPLSPADLWTLEIGAALTAADPRLRPGQPLAFPLGRITPFQMAGATGRNEPGLGRWAEVEFTREIDPETAGQPLGEAWEIEPAVPDLAVRIAGRTVQLQGEFQVNTLYRVRVPDGWRALDGSRLEGGRSAEFQIDPLPPRLMAPAESAEQLASGHRQFRLRAVNVDQVRLRAKRLERPHLIHALRGYQSYFKPREIARFVWEPRTEVDYNLLPGTTVLDRTIPLGGATDAYQTIGLSWDELLGGGTHGAVFLEGRVQEGPWSDDARLGVQSILQLTDLGLHWKIWGSRVLVHVFSHQTGAPLEGVRVELVSSEDERREEAITDANGLASFDGFVQDDWLVAQLGDDLRALPLAHYHTTLYQTGVETDYYSNEGPFPDVLLFTDRSVYRPGDTLRVKALARVWQDGGPVVPPDLSLPLVLLDPRGDGLFHTNLFFNARGSAGLELELPNAPRGVYRVRLDTQPWPQWHEVRVADYQPDAFNVVLDLPEELAPDEPIETRLRAGYYFGAPLNRARVEWTAHAADEPVTVRAFPDWTFSAPAHLARLGRGHSSFVVTGSGIHTARTNLVIAPVISFNPVAPQPRRIHLEAAVTDLNQQTLIGRAVTLKHSSRFYLGLRQPASVLAAGSPVAFDLAVVRWDGVPWPDPVTVTARVQRVEWETTRILGAGGRPEYRSEPRLIPVAEQPLEVAPVIRFGDRHLPATQYQPELTDPGEYLVELETVDPAGHRVLTADTFHVAARAALAWDYRQAALLELVPDRARYRPGDTATLLVKTPFSGSAWVSVERDGVLRSFFTRLEGNAPTVQVPITAGDLPNVFVSVTLLRGADDSPHTARMPDFRFGVCRLEVDTADRRLDIEVLTDAPDYLPAGRVQVTATVRNAGGQPVENAEVTLFAVDAGVLSLDDRGVPDPLGFFYRSRPLRVRSSLSLFRLLGEDPDHWTYANKGFAVGGGGLPGETLRRNWEPCPLWIGSALTDAAGRIEAAFDAPDSLTRYRVIAVAHTTDSRFGTGTGSFEVRKPLMLQPAVPQFARIGDRLLARALLHNQTGQAREIDVRLALDATAAVADGSTAAGNTTPASVASRRVSLGTGSSVIIEIPVRLIEPGRARWNWHAETVADPAAPRWSDAVESALEVAQVSPLLRQVLHQRGAAGETDLLAGVDPRLLEGEGQVTVRVANSRLLTLGEAFRELLHYPYGCAEQTASSLLPWTLLTRLPVLQTALGAGTEKTAEAVTAGVARLLSMQTASGGLAYWPRDGEAGHWPSAYGAVVLAVAQATGVAVPDGPFARLLHFLNGRFNQLGQAQPVPDLAAHGLAAFAFALAKQPRPEIHDALFARRGDLTIEQRALLAATIGISSGPDERTRLLLDGSAGAEEPGDWYGSPERVLAVRLLAQVICDPAEPAVDRLISELLGGRHAAHWGTTQGNAWSILALTEYAARVETPDSQITGEILSATQTRRFSLGRDQPTFTSATPLRPGQTPWLRLRHTGRGPLHLEVEIQSRSRTLRDNVEDQGFALRRSYARLDEQGEWRDLSGLTVGDPVFITLELRLERPAHFVAIEDPLPAVFEAVDLPGRRPGVRDSREDRELPGRRLPTRYEEQRADRTWFFVNHLAPGHYTIRYLVRARAAGEVTAPSARVEAMYDPSRRGLSGAQSVVCHPDRQ